MAVNLQFNNARDGGVWVRWAVDGGSLTASAVKAPSKDTTPMPLNVNSVSSLTVRVQGSSGAGSGKGDLTVSLKVGEAANGAVYILGKGGGVDKLIQNAALLLLDGDDEVGAISGKIKST